MKSVLKQYKVSDVLVKTFESPIILESKQYISQAAEILSDVQISAAPVRNSATREIEYLFDFKQICGLIHCDSSSFKDQAKYEELLEKGVTIEQVKKHGLELEKVGVDDELWKAAELFAQGVHKLPVFSNDKQFEGMISQSDLVQFIHDKLAKECHQVMEMTLVQLNIAKKRTIAINCQKKVKDAVELMVKENVSSVGLLDSEDESDDSKSLALMGIISLTDIKSIFHHRSFHQFNWKLCDFISELLQHQSGKTRFPVYSVRPQTSLESVIQKLNATRSHRIYVTEHMDPVGVVSLTDIIKAIIYH
jgi:CBS domain-containing protein